MGVRQKNISGIFRRFLFSFLLAGAATILVLGVIVQILTIKAVIHPANYDEQQLEQKREEIQEAEKVEERMLPYGTGLECLIIQAGGFTEHLQNQKEKKYGKLFWKRKMKSEVDI